MNCKVYHNEKQLTPSGLEAVEEVVEREGCEAGGGRGVRPLQCADRCAVVRVQFDKPLYEQHPNHVRGSALKHRHTRVALMEQLVCVCECVYVSVCESVCIESAPPVPSTNCNAN